MRLINYKDLHFVFCQLRMRIYYSAKYTRLYALERYSSAARNSKRLIKFTPFVRLLRFCYYLVYRVNVFVEILIKRVLINPLSGIRTAGKLFKTQCD